MNFLQIMLWGCHHSTVVLHITVLNHFLGVSCLYIGDTLCVKGTMLFNSWLEAQFLCLFDPKPDLFVLFLFNPLLCLYLFFPFRFNSATPIHLCLLEKYIYICVYYIWELLLEGFLWANSPDVPHWADIYEKRNCFGHSRKEDFSNETFEHLSVWNIFYVNVC